LSLVSSIPSQEIGWEEHPEMTYFVSSGMLNCNRSVNRILHRNTNINCNRVYSV